MQVRTHTIAPCTLAEAPDEGEGSFVTESTDLTAGTESTTARATAGAGLARLKLAQLQNLAAQLGITGAKRLRKSDLVAAIQDHQRGSAIVAKDEAEHRSQPSETVTADEKKADEPAQKAPTRRTRTRTPARPHPRPARRCS